MMLRVWDTDTGRVVNRPFKGHTNRILSVAYSPDGKRVLSGSADETLCEWDIDVGHIVAGPFKGHNGRVLSVAYSPDGKGVASGSSDMTIRVWDIETSRVKVTPFKDRGALIRSVAFSPDGKQIVTGSSDGTLRVWGIESGRVTLGPRMAHWGDVVLVAYSSNGERVVSYSSFDRRLRVWDAETGSPVGIPLFHENVQSAALSPDGMHVCSCSLTILKEWNLATGQLVVTPYNRSGDILSLAYSPNGKPITIVRLKRDNSRKYILADLWDPETGRTTDYTFDHYSTAYSLERNPIVSGSFDGTLIVCDIKTILGAAGPLQGHTNQIISVAYSSNRNDILSGLGTIYWDWDVETGRAMAGPFACGTFRQAELSPVDPRTHRIRGKPV
jgi:WD40 repeat protein